jgi:hypothetical protein
LHHLDTFIAHMAEHFQRAGGVANAPSQATPSDDHLNATTYPRKSPFLRALGFVHTRLPPSRRAENESALYERAHRLFEERRNFWIVAAFLDPHMPADRSGRADWRALYLCFPA